MMQAQTQIDAGLSTLDALQLAERLAAGEAIGERVALSVRLKNACRLHEKNGADDIGGIQINAELYVTSARCLRIIGVLLTAQAVAVRGLMHHPAHVPLIDELVAVHEALALRYREVAQRCEAAVIPLGSVQLGSDGH
jgi:hypothetical protein